MAWSKELYYTPAAMVTSDAGHNTRSGTAAEQALKVLGSLTGATAVITGLLYLAGIDVTSAEFVRSAHVSGRDTLPLMPLQQILGRGVSLVSFSIAVVAGAALLAVVMGQSEESLARDVRRLMEHLLFDKKAMESVEGRNWTAVRRKLREAQRGYRKGTDDDARIGSARLRVGLVAAGQTLLLFAPLPLAWFTRWPISVALLVIFVVWAFFLGARPALVAPGPALTAFTSAVPTPCERRSGPSAKSSTLTAARRPAA